MKNLRLLVRCLIFLFILSSLITCGGGNSGEIDFIEIIPARTSIVKNTTQQFTAIGIFADGTRTDVTSSVTWSSSDTAKATIDISGLAKAIDAGATVITAVLGMVSGSTDLTVRDVALIDISLTPSSPVISRYTSLQFTATGVYSDNTTQDLTSLVTWSSSNEQVISISNANGSYGFGNAFYTTNTATITATFMGMASSTVVSVAPSVLVSIELSPPDPYVVEGAISQYRATGIFSDSTTEDLTETVTWSSSDASVVSISNTAGSIGVATSLLPGNTVITAVSGTLSASNTMTVIVPVSWTSVLAGIYHSAAVKSDGTLWTWGGNDFGQLGNGTTINNYVPVRMGTETSWSSLSAGGYHNHAIKNDGTLWAWGSNEFGQLGNGTKTEKHIPTRIGSESNWVLLSDGTYHTVAIRSDGTLWAWGNNVYGQIGDGTYFNRTVPTLIGTSNNWKSVSAGGYHTVAIKSDGTLWVWGNNVYGQIGDGTLNNINVPTQIGTETSWKSVSAGLYHNIAIKTDGTLWSWGNNASGQLGDGITINKNIPTKMGLDSNWALVSAGGNYTVAIKTSGTLWSWGNNTINSVVQTNVTTQIGLATNWQSVAAKIYHIEAIKTDGTLWGWGSNAFGQIGDGTTTNRDAPTNIH